MFMPAYKHYETKLSCKAFAVYNNSEMHPLIKKLLTAAKDKFCEILPIF